MFEKSIYIKRRSRLKEIMKDGIIVIPGNNESPRNYPDNCYGFDQDSTFLYYFGIDIPHLIGVIDVAKNKEYIFGKDYTLDDIVWMGDQRSLRSCCDDVGVVEFIDMDDIEKTFAKMLSSGEKVHFTKQYRADNIMTLAKICKLDPYTLNDKFSPSLTKAIVSQRNTKSPEEIAEIEDAVNITRDMQLAAMHTVRANMKEYEVVAQIEAAAHRKYATTSFFTIFSKNNQILHNHTYDNTLEDGDKVLLDCGARNRNGYCGDMTTTFPVNGKFDERQKSIYSILIDMFDCGANTVRPGINYKDMHMAVCKTLAGHFKDLGIIKGSVDDAVAAGAHTMFFPHGVGHMLGMDVHDMEGLGEDFVGYGEDVSRDMRFGIKSLRLARILKPGYVFTIEPGIYFIPELIKRWKAENKFSDFLNYDEIEKYIDFGGMRYEGDFLITENGSRRLGKSMPKTADEIEEIMKNR